MKTRASFVLGALAIAAMVATTACVDDEESTRVPLGTPQNNLPTNVPVDDLLLGCVMTEAFSLEIPMLVARGEDPIPKGFDTINTGICGFSRPIESITLALDRDTWTVISATTLETPVTQVRIPLDILSGGPLDADLEIGSYGHRILAKAVDGEEVEIWSNPDDVWVLDPNVMPKDQTREVLQQVRMALEDIPLNSPLRTFERIEWPDASLGCPEPDTFYPQVVILGFRLVFEADGELHQYHTNGSGTRVVTCSADENGVLIPQSILGNLPSDDSTEDLLAICSMTEAFSLDLPMLVARGQDPIPRGFDAINTGICEFSRPIETITLALEGQSQEFFQVVTLDPPATQIRIPLDPALKLDPHLEDKVSGEMRTGSYTHRILARAVDGEEVVIWNNPDGVWVLDPNFMPKEQAREVLRQVRMVLEDIPQISLLSTFHPLNWPDAGLGCTKPDTFYAQVVTPGFRLVFETEDLHIQYHTNNDGSVVVSCLRTVIFID